MFNDSGVSTSYNLVITKPRNRFANIFNILASICYDDISSINLCERAGRFWRNKRYSAVCPNPVIRIDLPVMNTPNPGLLKY